MSRRAPPAGEQRTGAGAAIGEPHGFQAAPEARGSSSSGSVELLSTSIRDNSSSCEDSLLPAATHRARYIGADHETEEDSLEAQVDDDDDEARVVRQTEIRRTLAGAATRPAKTITRAIESSSSSSSSSLASAKQSPAATAAAAPANVAAPVGVDARPQRPQRQKQKQKQSEAQRVRSSSSSSSIGAGSTTVSHRPASRHDNAASARPKHLAAGSRSALGHHQRAASSATIAAAAAAAARSPESSSPLAGSKRASSSSASHTKLSVRQKEDESSPQPQLQPPSSSLLLSTALSEPQVSSSWLPQQRYYFQAQARPERNQTDPSTSGLWRGRSKANSRASKHLARRNKNNPISKSASTSSIFALYAARYAREKLHLALRVFKSWYHEQLTYHHLSSRMEFNQQAFDQWYRSRGRPLQLRALDRYDQIVIWIAGESSSSPTDTFIVRGCL